MMDINDIKWTAMSDSAIMKAIGAFIKHNRLEQNKTQSKLAEEAGINRSTLVEFEKGMRSNILTLIQLLRALNLLQVMKEFQIIQQVSPIQLAKLEQARRKRASKAKKSSKKTKSDW